VASPEDPDDKLRPVDNLYITIGYASILLVQTTLQNPLPAGQGVLWYYIVMTKVVGQLNRLVCDSKERGFMACPTLRAASSAI
jgi:hypothetical protein